MDTVKKHSVKKPFLVPLLVALTAPPLAAAQEPAPQPEPRPAVEQPQTPAPGAPREQPSVRPENRRKAIRMMEAILSRAVLGGAETLAEQLGSGNPNMSFFTGTARARGFFLDEYGVFFHVEIPEMQSSLVMSLTTIERDVSVGRTLDSLRSVIQAIPDGATKVQGEEALKTLQLQVGPLPQLSELAASTQGVLRTTEAVAVPDPEPRAPLLRDPSAVYRDAIKTALVDAMLEHSRGMNIQPNEWLTVAANRGDSPLAPNEIVTTSTLVLRIKGSDLAIYDADRTRKEEIRKRVEVREF